MCISTERRPSFSKQRRGHPSAICDELLILIVVSGPEPEECVCVKTASVWDPGPTRIDQTAPASLLLEAQRGMSRVRLPEAVGGSCFASDLRWKSAVADPEIRGGQ